MSTVIVLFLLDEQAFDGLVQPAIAEFTPGSSTGPAMELLRRAAEGADPAAVPDPKAGYERVLDELRAAVHGGADRDRPSLYEAYSGKPHPGLQGARESARFLLEELAESPSFPPRTRQLLVWRATRALVDNYCIPWSRFPDPVFRMTGSAGESYLADHGTTPDALLVAGGRTRELAKDWDVRLLLAAEARAWAQKLRGFGPPAAPRERADWERLLALFDEAAKDGALRLAVASE